MALGLSLLLTPRVRRWAARWGAVDLPDNQRRIHQMPTPRLGGLAIYFSFVISLCFSSFLGTMVGQGLRNHLSRVVAICLPATIIFLLGVVDDFRGLRASIKLAVQLAAVGILYAFEYRISSISLPFGASWVIPAVLTYPLTALWVVGITNAFNLIDGMDGLASGASVFALLSLFICSLSQGNPNISLMSIVLIGAVMGFLRYNFNPATIFLGDSGSLFLGFMAGSLSLASAQKGTTIIAVAIPLVSFGFPIIEVAISVLRRFISGEGLFQSDRRHIHHMLLRRGFNQRQVAILLYGVCALFSLFGILLLNPGRNTAAVIFAVVGAGVVLGVQHLRYAEFDALKERIKNGVTRHRMSLAYEARVRRGSADLSMARSADQLLSALSELCRASDFDYVALELDEDAGFLAAADRQVSDWKPVLNEWGRAQRRWTWKREQDDDRQLEAPPHQFWSLRVPLAGEDGASIGGITFYRDLSRGDLVADLAQICGGLRTELGTALSRLRLCAESAPQRLTARVQLANNHRTNLSQPMRGA
jgi:UDP-GlcNAc:undecaprenyl-phosphate GlcNAc-1-phosphate transferase